MEESRMVKYRLGYEKLLQALGRFCDEQKLDEICIPIPSGPEKGPRPAPGRGG